MKYNLTYTHFDELLASSVNPFPVEKQTYFLTRIYEALDAITAEPDIENWSTLADVINLLTTLVEDMDVLEDNEKTIQQAKDVIRQAFESGKNSISTVDSGIIHALVESLEEAVQTLPARVVIRAHRLTEKRVQSILNGRRQHGDIVI